MTNVRTSWLRLFEVDGSCWLVEASEEPRIDAAVERYLSSGRTHDALLSLTLADCAGECRTLASRIGSWCLSTPELREEQRQHEKLRRDEDREARLALGLPWEE